MNAERLPQYLAEMLQAAPDAQDMLGSLSRAAFMNRPRGFFLSLRNLLTIIPA